MARYVLLDAVNADSNGAGVEVGARQVGFSVFASDFGGGTVTFQLSPDSGKNWITPADATFTENAVTIFELDGSYQVRATLTGSTSPSGVTVYVDEGSQ